MSDQARKYIIRTAGILIILLALGAALLPLERALPGRLVVGSLLLLAGAIECGAALARRTHKPTAAIAGAATVLAGARLVLDPNAGFFPVLNLVILWLVIRAAGSSWPRLRISCSRSCFFPAFRSPSSSPACSVRPARSSPPSPGSSHSASLQQARC